MLLEDKISFLIKEVEEKIKFYENFQIKDQDIQRDLVSFLTIFLWSKIDNLLENIEIFEEFFQDFNYSIFNDKWIKFFQMYMHVNAKKEKFTKIWILDPNESETIFLCNLLRSKKRKITNNDILHLKDFFVGVGRYVHIDEYHNYEFFRVFLRYDKQEKIIWNYKSQYEEIDLNRSFTKLKTLRNELVHKNSLDSSLSNLANWNNIYWKSMKAIFSYMIDNYINKKKFFQKYIKNFCLYT